MSDAEPFTPRREYVGPDQVEVVETDAAMIDITYDNSGLDDLLHHYAGHKQDGINPVVRETLARLGHSVAHIALRDGAVDTELIRQVFERMHDSVEHAAAVKFGPEPPRTWLEARLIKAGVRNPVYLQRFSRLDDLFWDQQFMEQYQGQTWEKRRPDEPEEHFLGRYIGGTLYRFPWADYSHI